ARKRFRRDCKLNTKRLNKLEEEAIVKRILKESTVTSNNGKDLLPCADGIVVGKPLGILAANDGHRGARSRDVPSRQDGAISDGRFRM
ncbi:hypothetical protein COCMIDRAFT_111317, partial [Bipolaris oryzae ATCC 44560]